MKSSRWTSRRIGFDDRGDRPHHRRALANRRVLINAAGYGQYGALEDVPMADARRQLETNLIGSARLIQLCLPHMREQGSGKSSTSHRWEGKVALPLGGWYHASKFGLERLFRRASQ